MPSLHISAEAKRDIKGIFTYIGEEQKSPETAKNVVNKIMDKIENLMQFPDTGTLLAPKVMFETNIRYVKAAHFLIFYRHEGDCIFIDRIIYGKRDYIRILSPNREDA